MARLWSRRVAAVLSSPLGRFARLAWISMCFAAFPLPSTSLKISRPHMPHMSNRTVLANGTEMPPIRRISGEEIPKPSTSTPCLSPPGITSPEAPAAAPQTMAPAGGASAPTSDVAPDDMDAWDAMGPPSRYGVRQDLGANASFQFATSRLDDPPPPQLQPLQSVNLSLDEQVMMAAASLLLELAKGPSSDVERFAQHLEQGVPSPGGNESLGVARGETRQQSGDTIAPDNVTEDLDLLLATINGTSHGGAQERMQRRRSTATEGSPSLTQAVEDGVWQGFLPIVMRTLAGVIMALVILLAGVVVFDMITQSSTKEPSDEGAQVRQLVRSVPVLSATEVKDVFKERSGYDCLLTQPQASLGAVRLEGHVCAIAQNVLKAPLARRSCVLFTTSASTVRLDGIRAPPTAFSAMSSDFDLELVGCPRGGAAIRVRIHGRDVALFDVSSGWRLERTVLEDAPEHLQDFLHAHRAPGVEVPEVSEVLDFTECLLAVGARVTCFGELNREPTGELILTPLQDDIISASFCDSADDVFGESPQGLLSSRATDTGLTSWERAECGALPVCRTPRVGKVMISDDPALLGPAPASNVLSRVAQRTWNLLRPRQ